MDILQIMENRHSVRQYLDDKIEDKKRIIINQLIEKINEENNLSIKVFYDEPNAFNSILAHYGKFEGVNNYIALIGKSNQAEILGFYGEKIVLKMQEIGLNTCWVVLTYGRGKVPTTIADDEKIHCVISFGYGKNQGVKHKNKNVNEILKLTGEKPDYLERAIRACLLAPTAVNQQKFQIICDNKKVKIVKKGKGFCLDLDLGIVKSHFHEITGIKLI